MDPELLLWQELQRVAPWTGKTLVDLGCGSGYWLAAYRSAGRVIGVEPDTSLLALAGKRSTDADVLHGSAEQLPLQDNSADVIHARFAYFFPSRSFDPSPGLREAERVLVPGGKLVVIDNDGLRGEFSQLLRASAAAQAQGHDDYSTRWWSAHGATTTPIMSSWRFSSRQDLQAVLRLEFGSTADEWLGAHPEALGLTYGYLLHTWTKPL